MSHSQDDQHSIPLIDLDECWFVSYELSNVGFVLQAPTLTPKVVLQQLLLGKRGEAAQCGADRPIRSPFQRRSRPAVLVEGNGSPVVNCAQRTGGVSRGRRRSLLLGKRAEAEERRLAGELSSRGSGADGWRCVRALTWWRRRAAHRPRDGLGPLCRASRPRYCARARTAPAAEFRAGVGLGCPSRTARRWISWVASIGRSSNPSGRTKGRGGSCHSRWHKVR